MENFEVILGALVLVFGIIPAIIKSVKKSQGANNKANANDNSEPFSEVAKQEQSVKAQSAVRTERPLSDEREKEERLRRYREKKNAQKQKAAPQPVTQQHTHVGNAEVAFGETGTEVYAGEGCEEHYSLRFVTQDLFAAEDDEIDAETAYLRSVMVLGEILNEPKYKQY